MALTPEQEAELLAHLNNINNPHITTFTQSGLRSTDDLPEGEYNFYSPDGIGIKIDGADTYENIMALTTMQNGEIWVSTTDDAASGTNAGDGLRYSDVAGWVNIGSIHGVSATVTVGTVQTVDPDELAKVTNVGTENDAVFNFEIPQGYSVDHIELTNTSGLTKTYTVYATVDQSMPLGNFDVYDGDAATIAVGDVTSGPTPAVTNVGDEHDAIFDFVLAKGDAASVDVGDTTTTTPDQPASVTNSGDTSAAIFDFVIPRGKSVDHITRTNGDGSPGTTDTYTVYTSSDNSEPIGTFDVYNGADGTVDSSGMLKSVYDPNDIGANAFDRNNHIGTQTSETISDFTSAVNELMHFDLVDDETPQLGGNLDCNNYTLNNSAYRAIPAVSIDTETTYTIDYAQGDSLFLDSYSDLTLDFINFPIGKVATFLLFTFGFEDITVTYAKDIYFDGGVAPTYTSADMLLIIKDEYDDYTILHVASNVDLVS